MPPAFERRHLILMTWWFALRRQTPVRFSLAPEYDSALPPPGGCCLVTASSGCGRQWELEVEAVDWLVGLSFSLLCAFFVKNFAHSSKTVPWRCWRGRCLPDPAAVHRWDGWRWGLRMVWDVYVFLAVGIALNYFGLVAVCRAQCCLASGVRYVVAAASTYLPLCQLTLKYDGLYGLVY